MNLFFTSEDRYNYLVKNWIEEIYFHNVYLIRRFEYLSNKFEFMIEFFNPENENSICSFLFSEVTSFIDIIHEDEVFEASYEYNKTEDPIDFLESKKEEITEYFIRTDVRELWWRTNKPPRFEKG